MAGPLLETKLHVPAGRRSLVPRPRLSERLSRGTESALTLVSAPAGFGKTTLLTEWLSTVPAEGRSVAWLSVDQRDNDPALFWTYVATALQTAEPAVGAGALALLQSAQSSTEAVLSSLLNDLSGVADDVVLVLDDYHLIEARDVQDGMTFLLEHLPSRVHLVLATRAAPPLPLARLRARGDLVEVRVADLRFTAAEAAAYLEQVGLLLTPTDVATLEGRTEGWIAALQLAALSMQGRADVAEFIAGFAGDDRYIVDYLVEEVLQRQSGDVRSFLLQTSILGRLTAGCAMPSPGRTAAGPCSRPSTGPTCSCSRWTTAAGGTATTTSSRTRSARGFRRSARSTSADCTCGRAASTRRTATGPRRSSTRWPRRTSNGRPRWSSSRSRH